MSLFDENFLDKLSPDPKVGIYNICTHFISNRQGAQTKSLSYHFEFLAFCEYYIQGNNLPFELPDVTSGQSTEKISKIYSLAVQIVSNLTEYIRENEENKQLDDFRKKFLPHFKDNVFHYEFTDGDISRIQVLLNELRQEISNSNLFEDKHKRRLLKRLEKLQGELHKNVSDIDHFWGLVGDAGVAIGKFGKNAKPFVDRIKEITNIVWKVQSRAEELPSNLENPNMLGIDD